MAGLPKSFRYLEADPSDGCSFTLRARPLTIGQAGRSAGTAVAGATVAGTASAAGITARRHGSRRKLYTEVLLEELVRFARLLTPACFVLFATQPEVREVVQEEAEDLVAVLGVLGRVEDVGVPHRVDVLGGDDGLVRVHQVEDQEPAVERDPAICFLQGHPLLARLGRRQLVGDRLEVDLLDASLCFCQCDGCHDTTLR